MLSEARAIVLTPERTPPGGWSALKAVLAVDGSAREFLADLASDGGATLFIDSLDFFSDAARRSTIIDLVRTAADVPGFQVIVTARTNFDKDEPNWLPRDVLDHLGRALPVVIQELGSDEIEELTTAVPALRALLAENHPAREVARNLFRLSRLLEVQGSAEDLRSECDLLWRWWTTADGPPEGRRARLRLLSDLSDAAIAGADRIETRADTIAVDALIASETLREIVRDTVAFRHDVLREWGIAARLREEMTKLEGLPLARPATGALARGVELAGRLALEQSSDGRSWVSYVDRVSSEGFHGSWRRFSLLAILRSELALELLDRAARLLLTENGALLKELIRTAIATESRPITDTLAKIGVDASSIPPGIFGPSNASWARLAVWLLRRKAELPLQALPDVVELFQSLSASMFFADPLTPQMANALADWLDEIEAAEDHDPLAADQPRFASAYRYDGLHTLAEDVRHAFALMAARAPERARGYLLGVPKRRNPDNAIRDIMRCRGSFPQAAPAELAALTFAGLVPPVDKSDGRRRHMRDRIFSHLDMDFLPSSPSQGPFLNLLNAAPEQGLLLIRRLVDHAVTALTAGRDAGDDGLTLILASGSRFFPWRDSYRWSRGAAGCYSLESALMALEAWSHARIERGDAPDQVIADILGPDGAPAAYVLVAVDVLISHWPKTLSAITPFLGVPELLSIDRTRQVQDSFGEVDLLGWGASWPREPRGPVTLANLKERPSRRIPLEHLLGHITHAEGADSDGLRALLESAAERLGSPDPDDTFAEPRLMARHALNLIDPANWRPNEGRLAYVSPPEEASHVARLQAGRGPDMADLAIDAAIQAALEDAKRSTAQLAEQAVVYARRLETSDARENALGTLTSAIVSAALIVARDGSDQLLETHDAWVRRVFADAFATTEQDLGRSMRDGIRFNPVAIATLGMIHLWRRRQLASDRDMLLELAGRDESEAAQGFGAGVEVIRGIDPRLIPAVLRCALAASVHTKRRWDDPADKVAADKARYRERLAAVIEAERKWLRGQAEEPAWPQFPAPILHIKKRSRVFAIEAGASSPPATNEVDNEVYSQNAALWLRQLVRSSGPLDVNWSPAFVGAYLDWTTQANGAGHPTNAEIDTHLDDWNGIFFRLLARALSSINQDQALAAVERAIAVPDRSFFDIADSLVPAIDEIYFNGFGLDTDFAVRLRNLAAERLMKSAAWRRERDRSELAVETWIGPAIAVLFFNRFNSISGARCYLLAKGADQVAPFLPQLLRLIEEGPIPFTATLTMNMLEVSKKPEHAAFFLSSALIWLRRQPGNARLWVDSGLGARLAAWLEALAASDHSLHSAIHPLRSQIDEVLARLVRVGVAEAHRVESALADKNLE